MNTDSRFWTAFDWANFFSDILKYTLLKNEQYRDVLTGCWSLGLRRYSLWGNPETDYMNRILVDEQLPGGFDPADHVVFAFSIFCWFPLKPAASIENIGNVKENRRFLFQGIDADRHRLVWLHRAVPDELLQMNLDQLHALQASGRLAELVGLQNQGPEYTR